MADHTHIEWTDATWNPITGCSVVSPGCTNCYAMRLAGTRLRDHPSRQSLTVDTKAGPVWTGEVRFNDQWLDEPLRWKRPRRIFVCAHGDLFHDSAPDAWIDKVFAVMALSPQHTFQVLTKRPERMRKYFTHDGGFGRWGYIEQCARKISKIPESATLAHYGESNLPNVWLGVSVEDQTRADERIPILLDTPAAVRWVSAEPLLSGIDIKWALSRNPIEIGVGFLRRGMFSPALEKLRRLDWVVVGGESGPGARPMHPDWVRQIRDDCAAAGVPFLLKQWGEWAPDDGSRPISDMLRLDAAYWSGERWIQGPPNLAEFEDGDVAYRLGKRAAGRTLEGVIHDTYPEPRP